MSATALGPGRLTPWRKLTLVLEILATYVRVRWWLRERDLPSLVDTLRRSRPGGLIPQHPEELAAGFRLARAVARTLAPLPADTRCLVSSLVLTRLLARRGIHASLVIGVSAEADFAAHAWVESGEVALLPSGGSEYTRLVAL